MTSVVFRRFRIAPRAPVTFVMSIRLSEHISVASIRRISLRFDIDNFCENLQKNCIFLWNLVNKMSGTFHEVPELFLLLPATLNHHKSALFECSAIGCRIAEEV